MRHLFIINPAAGRPESTARLETLLSRLSFPHEVAYTREAGDAQRLAATAVRTGGPVRIYACGGVRPPLPGAVLRPGGPGRRPPACL